MIDYFNLTHVPLPFVHHGTISQRRKHIPPQFHLRLELAERSLLLRIAVLRIRGPGGADGGERVEVVVSVDRECGAQPCHGCGPMPS